MCCRDNRGRGQRGASTTCPPPPPTCPQRGRYHPASPTPLFPQTGVTWRVLPSSLLPVTFAQRARPTGPADVFSLQHCRSPVPHRPNWRGGAQESPTNQRRRPTTYPAETSLVPTPATDTVGAKRKREAPPRGSDAESLCCRCCLRGVAGDRMENPLWVSSDLAVTKGSVCVRETQAASLSTLTWE